MNARLETLPEALQPPTYDNEYLGWESDWIAANRTALLDWWHALGEQIGDTSENEFPSFARSQHDIELARREDFRNTLRQY